VSFLFPLSHDKLNFSDPFLFRLIATNEVFNIVLITWLGYLLLVCFFRIQIKGIPVAES